MNKWQWMEVKDAFAHTQKNVPRSLLIEMKRNTHSNNKHTNAVYMELLLEALSLLLLLSFYLLHEWVNVTTIKLRCMARDRC